jgi:hypothetical protein
VDVPESSINVNRRRRSAFDKRRPFQVGKGLPYDINPIRMDFKPMRTVPLNLSCRRCGGRLELQRA